MTLNEFCVGKTIEKIEAESRGSYEGSFAYIVFTDGSKISITDGVYANINKKEEMNEIDY